MAARHESFGSFLGSLISSTKRYNAKHRRWKSNRNKDLITTDASATDEAEDVLIVSETKMEQEMVHDDAAADIRRIDLMDIMHTMS